ncbi:MAG: hypothetical protein KA807_01290 [Prolixibacteraceae bacterium]|nr:hypothetical protein [Prolixibacteraceae bacterium]
MTSTPLMIDKGEKPLAIFPINGTYILAVYKGSLSKFDLLIKYRQLEDGKWSRIRTPKHIHWAVDILIKQHSENKTTTKFIEFLINMWDNKIQPIKSEEQRKKILNQDTLLEEVNYEALSYPSLANKGEYSIKFLILMAKLLMIQEKTNYEQAFMFRDLLEQLKNHKNIFKIVSTATHH